LNRDAGREILARRRAAAERLRREVARTDGSARHPYFRRLRRHLRDHRGAASLERVFASCARARVVCVGDFHAVPGYQAFAARLLRETAERVPRVALGVEFVYTRQQDALDARQGGRLSDAEFLRRIHYREEWGYPWAGFAALLDVARERGIAVHALDLSPRAGLSGVRRRDDHAARRIVSILERDPGLRLVVLFGESHLAPEHLPAKIARGLARAGVAGRVVTVLQSPDELYWRLMEGRGKPVEAVRLGGDSWAVMHTSPLAKYEAYRQVLERWTEDVPADDEVDLTPAVHHLIAVLLGWLGVRPTRRIRHRSGWSDDLADAFPEVYGGPDARELLPAILREHGRSRAEIREARARLADHGALYESRSNTMFLERYLPGPAAGEAARFLRSALTGRLHVPPEESDADPAARAYGAAYNEALAVLAARLVDPAGEPGTTRASGRAMASAATDRERWLRRHARFEASGRAEPPAALLEPLRGSRETARDLARALGRRLGRALYDRVRRGTVPRATLRGWFARALPPRRAPQVVLALLRER